MSFVAKVQLLAVLMDGAGEMPVSWYDELSRVLTKAEDVGVWPDGLLDANIAMTSKTDGDAAHLATELSVCSRLSIVSGLLLVWVSSKIGSSLGYLIRSPVLGVVVGR